MTRPPEQGRGGLVPLITIGCIALVILVFGLMTVNIVKAILRTEFQDVDFSCEQRFYPHVHKGNGAALA
jgi:hypothetical protein